MEEYRWEDNIKMDLKEMGVDVMNWIEILVWQCIVMQSVEFNGFSQLDWLLRDAVYGHAGHKFSLINVEHNPCRDFLTLSHRIWNPHLWTDSSLDGFERINNSAPLPILLLCSVSMET